ncbi:D-aminoacylase [Lacibacter luteus]|uniref:D-aminoacylase n=1 Tax=Lacibacter luteus TaxID=2508719 RepID=A0A4Q1CJM1_9BACT|nr:D-aminoacylase [Lacibacter luteus]RXK60810.1 D-aminoacylase [Lacibacter luteus]
MRTVLCFLFLIPLLVSAQQYDILITNGKIIDGTGNSWFYADVAVKDGKIVAVGKLNQQTAKKIIDAKGLIVAPGFIDVHTHIEGEEAKTPTAENFIYDGVTTVVTGNCGSSQVDMGRYFKFIDSVKLSINVAALVGHNDVRKAVMGRAMRDPGETEMQQMVLLVEQAMKQGAVGLSTGLIYIPGTYSKTNEVVLLAAASAKYNGVYASHIRNEGDSVAVAIREAIQIGRLNKMPVEISHFKVSGQQNWGRSKETVALIENARNEGIDVTIDQYPYTASSTQLSTMLPDEILADGQDSIVARLNRTDVRSYVIESMLKSLKKRRLKHFSYPVVANYRFDTTLNGKSIEEVNLIKGKKHKASAEAETVIEMMLNGGAQMVFHGMSEPDVKRIMQYPYNMFASDAGIRAFGSGVPHPRGYGTNARVLSKYVREENVLTLEEAVRRMTSLPAQKFQLKDRGLLKEGMAADIIIFDATTVKDNSTFDQPHQYTTGFKFVLVNGQLVVDEGKHNGTRSGVALKGPGYLQ